MPIPILLLRIEDIERDVVLPPLKQDTVWLELDDFSRKSYNAMQAVIAVNAIDTQRVDVVRWLLRPSSLYSMLMVYRIISFTNGSALHHRVQRALTEVI